MIQRVRTADEIEKIIEDLPRHSLPAELRFRVESMLEFLTKATSSPQYFQELESTERYLSWVLDLPWDKKSKDRLDLSLAAQILEKNHYGMARIKERVLEYIAVLNLTKAQPPKENLAKGTSGKEMPVNVLAEATILCFTGLPGLGKTSVALSIAESLGRSLVRIPFGGLGEVSQIRGLPRHLAAAEPGQIIKGLRRSRFRNPVILLDEIDRVSDPAKGVVMGALLELLDPEQNREFTDYYIDFPFNLSDVLFICTCNNTRGIANAVLDRLEVIEMPSYSDDEKIIIGRDYLFPKIIKRSGLAAEQVKIDEHLWPKIVRPLGFDAGMRTLERTIEAICRKVARKVVEGQGQEFLIKEENIKEFLPVW